jgi:CRISPR/Cas system endoribonuclease Cas6 (RAMP superfamily)
MRITLMKETNKSVAPMQIAYESGLGEKGSMGFGMIAG